MTNKRKKLDNNNTHKLYNLLSRATHGARPSIYVNGKHKTPDVILYSINPNKDKDFLDTQEMTFRQINE